MRKRFTQSTLALGLTLLAPLVTLAQYKPLSREIPQISTSGTWPSITEVLNGILGISVGLAAVLAVVMLAIGGFKYMTTDSVVNLGSAKEQIANAIIGLLIVLTAILVLRTINPEIVSLSFFAV